jgi:hypothetical protein
MVHDTRGGSLAARRRDQNNSRLPGAVPPGPHSAGPRQVTPAEAAQARLFEGILRNEIAEMLKLPPHAGAEMRARIAEADRLIKALRHRFPHGPTPATPLMHELRAPADPAQRALIN